MDLTIFVAITAAALVLQAGVLVGMFLAMRKSGAKIEQLADEIRTRALPAAEVAHAILVDMRPKIENTITNVSETTTVVREQVERLDATVNDVIDRARLQVIRADELVTRTIDRVEDATEKVHETVVSPIRRISGLVQGLTAGLEFLVGGKRRRRNGVTVPQDEMFI